MADPTTAAKERIRVFGRDGAPIAEFRAAISRSWAIGDEGRAEFTYSTRKTDVVNEKVLQFGNWVLVQHDNLPPWVGVIDTPREWSTRNVTVYLYSPEHVFGWRRGPLEQVISGSAGTIFENLVNFVNQPEATIIQTGNIFRGGNQRQETINPTQLDEDLKRIQERSKEEYQWRPAVDAQGRLVVYADWLQKLGVETAALLHEGKGGGNLEAVGTILTEDGPIQNDIFSYGDGETWQSKPNTVVIDLPSIGKYGRRQNSLDNSGVITILTLTNNGNDSLNEKKQPARTFHLNALNVGDTFNYCRLGNILTLRFQNIGFYAGATGYETQVRIMGMAFDPLNPNKVELVVEEQL